ncbi:MAG: DUF2752 domain-containing protein [Planctomycetaceae bacterium]
MSAVIERAPISAARHWQVLGLALGAIFLALTLEVTPNRAGIAFKAFPDGTLPELCLTRQLFGAGCPVCGLTRSIVHFMHGRIGDSFAQHHLGWLIGLTLVAQVPYRLVAICRRNEAPLSENLGRHGALVLAGLFIVDWVLRVVIRLFA